MYAIHYLDGDRFNDIVKHEVIHRFIGNDLTQKSKD